TTNDVGNYPGFPAGSMGPELMVLMRGQAERFGTTIVEATAERVDLSKRPFQVWTDDGRRLLAKTLIVATGASAKLLGIPSEAKYMGMGVSACATCDGSFFRDKRITVVGGGDTGMGEGAYLPTHGAEG